MNTLKSCQECKIDSLMQVLRQFSFSWKTWQREEFSKVSAGGIGGHWWHIFTLHTPHSALSLGFKQTWTFCLQSKNLSKGVILETWFRKMIRVEIDFKHYYYNLYVSNFLLPMYDPFYVIFFKNCCQVINVLLIA